MAPLRGPDGLTGLNPDHDISENGGLLPGPGAILTGPTLGEWLSSAS